MSFFFVCLCYYFDGLVIEVIMPPTTKQKYSQIEINEIMK
jgi:hypothetical protein